MTGNLEMEQIIIQVKDKEKAKALRKWLVALDYVESVEPDIINESASDNSVDDPSTDFFSTAGMWQDRDVTLDSLRQKAWPGRDR